MKTSSVTDHTVNTAVKLSLEVFTSRVEKMFVISLPEFNLNLLFCAAVVKLREAKLSGLS